MWMPPLEPALSGKVVFYDLVFGSLPSYAFLVWFWRSWRDPPLPEWRSAGRSPATTPPAAWARGTPCDAPSTGRARRSP